MFLFWRVLSFNSFRIGYRTHSEISEERSRELEKPEILYSYLIDKFSGFCLQSHTVCTIILSGVAS